MDGRLQHRKEEEEQESEGTRKKDEKHIGKKIVEKMSKGGQRERKRHQVCLRYKLPNEQPFDLPIRPLDARVTTTPTGRSDWPHLPLSPAEDPFGTQTCRNQAGAAILSEARWCRPSFKYFFFKEIIGDGEAPTDGGRSIDRSASDGTSERRKWFLREILRLKWKQIQET